MQHGFSSFEPGTGGWRRRDLSARLASPARPAADEGRLRTRRALVGLAIALGVTIAVAALISAYEVLVRGSQWWCLTDACIEHFVKFLEGNDDYVRFFRFTRASDEIFFHTIVHASPFKDRTVHHFEWSSLDHNDHASHYVDWTGGDASPKVLDEDDLDRLLRSSCLFARKFSGSGSGRLLTLLEKHIA